MSAAATLRLEYLESAPDQWADTLGAARYGAAPHDPAQPPAALPQVTVHMPVLEARGALLERWRAGRPVRYGHCGAVQLAQTEGLLFGSLAVEEAPAASTEQPLEHATEWAYRQIHAALETSGHRHLVRVWNYLPRINLETAGLERYRQFNRARQRAFLACGWQIDGNVPAASALGSSAGALVIYFLAASEPPSCIENPRQVSAYHYPPQYGARAPSFSRATLLERPGGRALFISGTSSIVGHRTLHAGDPAAQTRETLTNIATLLEQTRGFTLADLAYKVYVRRPADLPLIRRELDAALGPRPRRVYLQADVCRNDLDVEIEAAGGCDGP